MSNFSYSFFFLFINSSLDLLTTTTTNRMKSLLTNYFKQNEIKQQQNEIISSFSSLTSSSITTTTADHHQRSQASSSTNESNIKYIDDIDTDGACYSSTDDDETDLKQHISSKPTPSGHEYKQLIVNQMKSNDTGKYKIFIIERPILD